MNILITNRALAGRSGTEVVVRDLSLGLKDRGHHPRVYSPVLGPMAEEIRGHGIAVCKVSVATYLSAGCRKLVTFTEVSALMVQSRRRFLDLKPELTVRLVSAQLRYRQSAILAHRP